MAMTFRGLEFCHRNFVLHRVRVCLSLPLLNMSEEPRASLEINSLT
jgi:hypothetical protein